MADRFALERLAGSGGMAAVFRATDLSAQRPVALKIAYGNSQEESQRFAREAELLAGLSDDRVVGYVAHGFERGFFYLALEWLDGEDLGSRLDRLGLTVSESLMVVAHAARAVAAVHAQGLIHRDLKPSNLFLVEGALDRVKLIDFGIARPSMRSAHVTRSSQMIGTPMYMAPEQISKDHQLTAAVDVYALGCVLYECLTGMPPHNGDSLMELFTAILVNPAPPPSSQIGGIPPDVDEMLATMLEKDPSRRIASADEVAEQLLRLRAELDMPRTAGPTRMATPLMLQEQRLVTVLVAQPPATSRAPGGLTLKMDDISTLLPYERLSQIVQAHGARAEPIGGVGVVVVPQRHGHPVARAARCALALRAIQPDLRLGMATRPAVMTEGWPFGEAIEHALELAAQAEGSVLIDDTTARMLDPQFVTQLDGAGPTHRLLSHSSRPKSTLTMASTPLVGRKRELVALEGALEDVVTARAPQAVIITAAAGMGKSRVAHETMLRVRRQAGTLVAIARADPIAAGSPYGLAAQTLRHVIGFDEGIGRERRIAHLIARCDALDIVDPARSAICDGLDMLLDAAGDGAGSLAATVPRDPRVVADAIRHAFTTWLSAEAARARAVVIFLEDLHWGDLPSVRLFDHVLSDLAGRPVLLIALARPEVVEAFPELWSCRDLQILRMRPLTPGESRALVRSIVGPAHPQASVERLVARGEGNAYYLEELARAARDGREGLPDSVLALAQARLDHLSPEARRTLRAASVFGEVFWAGGVLALLGQWHAAELDALLAELVDERIITQREGDELGGAPGFAFAHEILREAAYATLPDADRGLAHMLAATWMEEHRDVDSKALAEQWRRSSRPQRAVPWFERAARRALEGHDFATALACVSAGLSCGAEGVARGRLQVIAAEAYEWSSDETVRERCGLRALEDLEPGTPDWFEAFHHALLAGARLRGVDAVAPLCDTLEQLPDTRAPDAQEVIAMARTAGQLIVVGGYDRGYGLLEKAERAAARLGELPPRAAAWLEWARAWQELSHGNVLRAYERDLASLRAFEAANDVRNMAYARTNVGYEQLRLGLLDEADQSLRSAYAIATRLGLDTLAANALHNLSLVRALRGDFDEARRMAHTTVEVIVPVGHPRVIAAALDYLARIELMAGDLVAAEAANLRALDTVRDFERLQVLVKATRARILLAQSRAEEALACAVWANEKFEAGGQSDGEEAYIAVAYAGALHANGRHDEAQRIAARGRAHVEQQAAQLDDPRVRAAFLAIPDHAELIGWTGSPSPAHSGDAGAETQE